MNTYPTTPDLTIEIGDKVRSYDFPGRTDCYADGYVVGISRDGRYVIEVSRYVLEGDSVANFNRIVYTPMNGSEGLFGPTRGVVRR